MANKGTVKCRTWGHFAGGKPGGHAGSLSRISTLRYANLVREGSFRQEKTSWRVPHTGEESIPPNSEPRVPRTQLGCRRRQLAAICAINAQGEDVHSSTRCWGAKLSRHYSHNWLPLLLTTLLHSVPLLELKTRLPLPLLDRFLCLNHTH